MLIAKLPAAIVGVLLMSPVSAKAMEFADRPGSVSEALTSALTIGAISSDERSHRQINNHNILHPVSVEWMKLADRPRPISNLKRVWVVQTKLQNRSGRLSAEFSTVVKGTHIRFEYGPGEVSSWLTPTTTPIAMKFDHHPGPIGNLFPPSGAENIKIADRSFTSSLRTTRIPTEIWPRNGSARLCVGSMAPCGSLNFAEMGSLSRAYTERL